MSITNTYITKQKKFKQKKNNFLNTKTLSSLFRFWACPDVQRRVRAGEPSPGGGLQTCTEQRLWYFRQLNQETETNPSENGYWYGMAKI